MVDRGIIFSKPMVLALIAGRKTQTRRLATSPLARLEAGDRLWVRETVAAEELSRPPRSVALNAKDRRLSGRTRAVVADELDGADGVRYLADDVWNQIENSPEAGEAWSVLFHYALEDGERPDGRRGRNVPAIHMPRWASRLTLVIEAIRTEPLQAITEADAEAEGMDEPYLGDADPPWEEQAIIVSRRMQYRNLWNRLNDKDGRRWTDNPEVVVITFRVVPANIDKLGTCDLCADLCRGHSLGHPEQWEPEAGSRAWSPPEVKRLEAGSAEAGGRRGLPDAGMGYES